MRAVQLLRYGDADRLEYTAHAPRPVPAANQVLLRVRAAGVNPIDLRLRRGELRWLLHNRLPLILGNDVAGEVVAAVGDIAERRFQPGDRVFGVLDSLPIPAWHGFAGPGAYAEYAITREDTLCAWPAEFSAANAAALPLAGLTAWQALHQRAHIHADQTILINGASGGVGLFAVQLAHIAGAEVTGSCSPGHAGRVRDFGADHILDYRSQPLRQAGPRYHLIYDVAGVLSYRAIKHRLHPGGLFVSNRPTLAGLLHDRLQPLRQWLGHSPRHQHVWLRPDPNALAALLRLWQQHRLHIPLSRIFDLREAAEAHRFLESPASWGKVVLQVP